MNFLKSVFLFFCLIFSIAFGEEKIPDYTQDFIHEMVNLYHFDKDTLNNLFAKVQYDPEVIYKIKHPYEKKPWTVYQSHFLTYPRIQHGVSYWKKNQSALNFAYQRYGIPPSIIVALLGVETFYAEKMPTFNALSTLSTLALHNDFRRDFFKKELIQFLLLSREQKLSLDNVKSSYAGAIGITQFMPSTYRHYAISFSPSKSPDLTVNHADAIVSVANYLHLSGWKKDQPIAEYLQEPAKSKQANANLTGHLITLPGQTGPEYWIIFKNFKAIMRYNPKINYAMAVFQLSRAITEAYKNS